MDQNAQKQYFYRAKSLLAEARVGMPEAPPGVMERDKDNKVDQFYGSMVEIYVQGGSGSKIVDARETFGTLLEISK